MILQTGCLIDCSHFSPHTLDMEIIQFAERIGWNGGAYNNMEQIHADWDNYIMHRIPADWQDGPDSDFFVDYREALDYAASDALEWLNDSIARDDCYFTIDDNSLFYWEDGHEGF